MFINFILILLPFSVFCETGYQAWLRYPPVLEEHRHLYSDIFKIAVTPTVQTVIYSGVTELSRGLKGLLGIDLRHQNSIPNESAVILSTIESIKPLIPDKDLPTDIALDGYHFSAIRVHNTTHLLVTGLTEAGVLYGAFALLRRIALYKPIKDLKETHNPYSPLRYTNEWDNLDGSIERGFAGKSIYFADNTVVQNLTRAEDYARLLASLGINGCAVHNVNANTRLITTEFLPQLKRLAHVFSRWAVRVVLSVDLSSPEGVGGLKTFDPLDPQVIEFWANKTDEIYKHIPDMGGYLLKADVEGRPGPSKYNRTAAQAANTLARALKPHNGIVFYRGFVYNNSLDWKNLTVDRAVAAYHNFQPLDGQFDDNVIIQIKLGPIDFQIREGVSPLLGALRNTNIALEVEVTQEYTGQQRHVVFLPQMWKWVLDFDLRVDNQSSPVKSIASGKQFNRTIGGMVGVVNVGLSENWMANDLSMANVYGFGRLGWDPDLSADEIADEWTRLTFNANQRVVETVKQIQLQSYEAFENYSGPLGTGSLTDMVDSKYGPNIMASEHNGWGQWHRADHKGIGMERTVAGLKGKYGTGFIGEYSYEVMEMYESLDTCPDNLLLFMHHVNYTHVLHSGKTLIQHIYDSHYSGAETVHQFYKNWTQIKGLIDGQRYDSIERRLHYQSGHSVVWRDSICQWFSNMSDIEDRYHRIGHNVGRIEAETMHLSGYVNQTVNPWETASAGLAVECKNAQGCSGQTTFSGDNGAYDISVQYYDENDGISHFKLYVGSKLVIEWRADDSLPGSRPSGDTSTRVTAQAVALKKGDIIRVEGIPDHKENAVLDYIELHKH